MKLFCWIFGHCFESMTREAVKLSDGVARKTMFCTRCAETKRIEL